VVILDDYSDNPKTQFTLHSFRNVNGFTTCQHKLEKDFSDHKNVGNSHCSGQYIFAIDADEIPSDFLLENLHTILESNTEVELYQIPRVNILRGLNELELKRWGWGLSKLEEFTMVDALRTDTESYKFLQKSGFIIEETPWVDTKTNMPSTEKNTVKHYLPILNWANNGDYQSRLYKNSPEIKWTRPLHEFVVGAKVTAKLPLEPEYALIHDKTLERQLSQNMFYNTNWNQDHNVRKTK
jgi:hypothetical protein